MDEAERCQLYLAVEAGEGAVERLRAAAAAAPIACVLIEGASPARVEQVRALLAGARGLALPALISGEARLARTLRADGLHLPFSEDGATAYEAAREILSPGALVGVDAGRSRHAAMTLGEAGADYIGFGIPDFVADRVTARARRLELVAWWAGIFEVPCVAFDVDEADEARELAAAGADFVAVRIAAAIPPAKAHERVAAFADAIRGRAPRTEEARP